MKISFGNMTVELNIFHIRKQPLDYDQMNQVCLIEEILDEVIEESSIENPLEACLAQFSEDFDLDKLMECTLGDRSFGEQRKGGDSST
jgi:hypothetical protein